MIKAAVLVTFTVACASGHKEWKADLSPVQLSAQEQQQCDAFTKVLLAGPRGFPREQRTFFGASVACTNNHTSEGIEILECEQTPSEDVLIHQLRGCLAGWESWSNRGAATRDYYWQGNSLPSTRGGAGERVAGYFTLRVGAHWDSPPDRTWMEVSATPGIETNETYLLDHPELRPKADEPPKTEPPKTEPPKTEPPKTEPPTKVVEMKLEAAILAAVEAYPDDFRTFLGTPKPNAFPLQAYESKVCVETAVACTVSDTFMMKRSRHLAFTVEVYSGADEKIVNAAYDVVEKHLLAMTFPFETVTVGDGKKSPRFRIWQPKPTSNFDPKWKGLTIEVSQSEYLTGKLAPEPMRGYAVYVSIGKAP